MAEPIDEQSNDKRYEVHKQWGQENVDKRRVQRQRQRERDKARGLTHERAREAVRQAKENGTLVQPAKCQKCGVETSELLFHHAHGYKPGAQLKGKFLCHKCHTSDNNKPGDATYKGEPVRESNYVDHIANMITEDPDLFNEKSNK